MTGTLLIAATLLGQMLVTAPADTDHVDVAYGELVNGQPTAAIARINANSSLDADDPAALINLGAAYAMLGEKAKAGTYYRAAIASDARYDLQLADGSWMDSRRAARKAAAALARNDTLAVR